MGEAIVEAFPPPHHHPFPPPWTPSPAHHHHHRPPPPPPPPGWDHSHPPPPPPGHHFHHPLPPPGHHFHHPPPPPPPGWPHSHPPPPPPPCHHHHHHPPPPPGWHHSHPPPPPPPGPYHHHPPPPPPPHHHHDHHQEPQSYHPPPHPQFQCSNCGLWNYTTTFYPSQTPNPNFDRAKYVEPAHLGSDEAQVEVYNEGEEDEEESYEFVLTDEWLEFFAKSEARRREKKKQQKKNAQNARKARKAAAKAISGAQSEGLDKSQAQNVLRDNITEAKCDDMDIMEDDALRGIDQSNKEEDNSIVKNGEQDAVKEKQDEEYIVSVEHVEVGNENAKHVE